MAQPEVNDLPEDEDMDKGGDAPLIDLNEAAIKKLIARAKKRGYITYDELNAALPQDQMASEQIEDIMSAISDMGVNIVESDEDVQEEADAEPDDDVDVAADTGGATAPAIEKKKEIIDRTDDPVRMYLREMGAVELLSREGEIAIAKRIEAGRDTMILGLCESAIFRSSLGFCSRWTSSKIILFSFCILKNFSGSSNCSRTRGSSQSKYSVLSKERHKVVFPDLLTPLSQSTVFPFVCWHCQKSRRRLIS